MKRKLYVKRKMMAACVAAMCLMMCACGGSGGTKQGSAQADSGQQGSAQADSGQQGGAQSGSEPGTTQEDSGQQDGAQSGSEPGTTQADSGQQGEAESGSEQGGAQADDGQMSAGESDNGWRAAYASVISGLKAAGEEDQMPNIIQFAFVDEDDVPEMAVYFTEEGTNYSFYTYSEGEVKQLGDDIPYFITLNILSKENKFVYSFSKGRYREDAFGSISSGKMDIVPYGVEDRKEEDASVFTWLDEEVTEEEYHEKVSGLLDGREADTIIGTARHSEDADNKQFFTVDDAIAYLAGA